MSTEEENYRNLYPDLAANGGVLDWSRKLLAQTPVVAVNGWNRNYTHFQCSARSAQLFIGMFERKFSFDFWEEGKILANGDHTDFERTVQIIKEWVTGSKSAEAFEQEIGFVKARSNHPKTIPRSGAYLASGKTLKKI